MNSTAEEPQQSRDTTLNTKFLDREAGLEAMDRTIALLRVWAACPGLFDQISADDRQNLFLVVLELAESAQARLKRPH